MQHKLSHFHLHLFSWRSLFHEELVALLLVLSLFAMPVSAAMRFQERGLYMQSTDPGATTSYTVSFRYMSPQPIGSVDFLFCEDPIPHHDCVTPPGLDVSNATLSNQAGETGFSILSRDTNHIVLSRASGPNVSSMSSYKFDNIVNPTDTSKSFSIRLKSLASSDGTGAQIDFGSVKGQVANGIFIETQVPPMLVFCIAQEVNDNCAGTNDTFYTDMGTLDSNSTLTAQSEMAVGTNASGGFAITLNGTPMSAATNVIDSPSVPTPSTPGKNQFGINLVENIDPNVGKNPEGEWANAIASPNYSTPNMYMYVPGDVVAYSPNVSLMKKFTVSYILNASPNLRAGVYTTTMTFIASGRF